MFKRLKLSYLMALLMIPALVLSGCSFGKKARGDQVLNLVTLGELPNLNSMTNTDAASGCVLNNTMEGLYRLGEGNKVAPGMAMSEEVSKDGKTYTFKLRDANWSDGKPVTAHDFEYAWKTAADPKTASQYAEFLYVIEGAEEWNKGKGTREGMKVKALDAKTIEIVLKKPLHYFKSYLAFFTYLPLRQDIVEKHGDKYAKEAKNMVYNGPFVLSEWKHNSSYQLKKNENYWDRDTVKLKEVNTSIIKDSSTALNLYKTGELDVVPLDAEAADAYKDSKERFLIEEAVTTYLEFNQENPLFKNVNIRRAVSMAVDKEALVKSVLKNGSIAAGALVPPSISIGDDRFRDKASANVAYNPTEAKKLWGKGLKELKMQNLSTIELLGDNHSPNKKVLEFVQAELRKNLGANIEISPVPYKQRLERAAKHQFQMVLSLWGGDYNEPMTFMDLFLTGKHLNHGFWSNKEYDALVAKADMTQDTKDRAKYFAEAEKILIERDSGIAPLYYRLKTYLKKNQVQNVIYHNVGADYSLKWASMAK